LCKLGEGVETGAGKIIFGIRNDPFVIGDTGGPLEGVEGGIPPAVGDEPEFFSRLNFDVFDLGRHALGGFKSPLAEDFAAGPHDSGDESVALVAKGFEVARQVDFSRFDGGPF